MFVTLPYPPGYNSSVRSRRAKSLYAQTCAKILENKVHPREGNLYLSVRMFPQNFCHDRGDIDNLLKTLLDALSGYCFYDDSQVRRIYADMMDSAPDNPRVEITVMPYIRNFKRKNNNE